MSNLLPELPPTFANLQQYLGQRTPPAPVHNPNILQPGGGPVAQQLLDYLVAHKIGMFGREGGAGGQYPWGIFSYWGLTPGTLPTATPPPPATPPAVPGQNWPHPDWLSQIQGRLPRPHPLPVQHPGLPVPQQQYGAFLRSRLPKPPTIPKPRQGQGLWPS